MVKVTLAMLLYAASVMALNVPRDMSLVPRDLTDGAKKALEDAGVDIGKTTPRPTEKVNQILGIGDSYSAGIGSNGEHDNLMESGPCSRYVQSWQMQLQKSDGWLDFNDGKPDGLVFGACSGAVMKDLREKELKQGDPKPEFYPAIGKPQIAVLTISGNDAKFSDIVKECIYNLFKEKSCNDRLTEIEALVKSADLKQEILNTYSLVINAGRQAGGANPAEAFQVYVGGYIGFFNHDDPGCDDISWSKWGEGTKLTTDLRRRLNNLADDLNGAIKSAAEELKDFGVVYVEGYQKEFDTHRFCEPADKKYHENQDIGKQTWFWSLNSPWNDNDEGPDSLEAAAEGDPSAGANKVLELFIADENVRKSIGPENPPWNVEPAFNDAQSMNDAIAKKVEDDPSIQWQFDGIFRIFHPKGSAYTQFARYWVDAIKNNRDPVKKDPGFKSGMCKMHVREFQTCFKPDDANLECEVTIKGDDGVEIGSSEGRKLCGSKDGLQVSSKLPGKMEVTAQHQNDYIQFTYQGPPRVSFTSGDEQNDDHKDGWCKLGGWDPRRESDFHFLCGVEPSLALARTRDMDCEFKCDAP